MTIGVIATLIGVPAGVIAGRFAWAVVAHCAGVGVGHDVPGGSLIVAIAVAMLGSLAIAVIVTRFARRRQLAETPRAD